MTFCHWSESSSLLVHGPLAVTLACDTMQACVHGSPQRRLKRVEYRNITPLVCGEHLYVGVHSPAAAAAAHHASPALRLRASSASATGYLKNVWTANNEFASVWLTTSPIVDVSIWNARRQLALTMRAEFDTA